MKSKKTLTLGVKRELTEYRAQGTTDFGCHPGKMGTSRLAISSFESHVQRQDCNPRIIQHELPMHKGIVCQNMERKIGRNNSPSF